ncbi:hypothetical protein Nepgr_016514 [Nepenthes gracilis]|uniref:Uncharacterized protein n=1 Tax=Nepenthes gracilis TaxID=150966 RepID=A0AAD3SMU8_NEPGR|nr:hypothetical protein Nepgr_016514 [Nepenthes gracilis]
MARGRKLRIAMLPCPAFGHLIPYLQIAKRLAQKGHHISFISTPRNIQRLPRVPQHLAPLIDLVSFPLPPVEGLPSDAEAGSDIPAEDLYILVRAYDGLQKSIAEFLETSNLDWVFYDIYISWLPQIAARFGIRRAFYTAIHTCSLCMCGPSSGRIEDLAKWPPSEDLTRPPKWIPFPSKAKFQQHEVNAILDIITASEEMSSNRLLASIKGCDVIVLRSCMETEDAYLKIIGEIHGKPVIPLGLMPPSIQESEEDNTWKSIKEWLDKNEKHSVVYIAMGSQYLYLTQENFTELALGLELSKLPFFWVAGSSKNHSFHLPDGFEERTKHHGLICTTWAPQIKNISS